MSPIKIARALFICNARTAISYLAPSGTDDEQVHCARKALKSARAALRLLRPRIGESTYSRENRTLRDAARQLSELRDARTVLASLDLLHREARHRPSTRLALEKLRSPMQEKLELARKDYATNPAIRQQCIDEINGSCQRISAVLKVKKPYQLSEAVKRIYRKARKAYRQAKNARDDESLHEWRKQTKYLGTSAKALQKSGLKELRGIAKRAGRVADRLGDDHDLAVLGKSLINFSSETDATILRQLISRRRTQLQRRAFQDGALLFAHRPGAIAAGLRSTKK